MSQTAALQSAVTALTTAVNTVITQSENVTPDADVSAAVTAIGNATSQLTTAFPPPTTP